MNRSQLLSIALLVIASSCKAPATLWGTRDAYLGEAPPADTPKIFAKGLLAGKGAWAGDRVAFSADGKEFYYSYNTTWFDTKNQKLKYMKYIDGKWQGPYVLIAHYYGPSFSKDGKTMYLMGGSAHRQNGFDQIAAIHRNDTGWSKPEPYLERRYILYDFTLTNSGNMYLGSNGTWGSRDWNNAKFARIDASRKDTTIRSLGIPINAPGFNGDFFVAPDESYMIVSAKEQPDFECELYISFHKPDDTWTNPKSLGPLINNDKAHRWGEYVTPDGKYLFYTHGHSAQDCGILWVRFDNLLEKLKHSNFEPYVKDSIKTQVAKAGQQYSFKVPGNTFFDDDGNNTLTLSVAGLPEGLTFDAVTKIINGKAAPGNYNISITATDNAKATAISEFLLKIN